MNLPETGYKVLTGEEMSVLEKDGIFAGAPVDLADGFIHLSTADQLEETVAKHFANQSDLHIAAVNLQALGNAVKWEISRGVALFPHIYASLPLSAVITHSPLERDGDGKLKLPVAG